MGLAHRQCRGFVTGGASTLSAGKQSDCSAGGLTPPEIRPDGAGYMDLTYAACWIATEGGKVSFFYRDKEVWRSAFDKLLPAMASGEIEVIGRQRGGLPAPIIGDSLCVDHGRISPYHEEVRFRSDVRGKALCQVLGRLGVMSEEHGGREAVGRRWRFSSLFVFTGPEEARLRTLAFLSRNQSSIQDRGSRGAPVPCPL